MDTHGAEAIQRQIHKFSRGDFDRNTGNRDHQNEAACGLVRNAIPIESTGSDVHLRAL